MRSRVYCERMLMARRWGRIGGASHADQQQQRGLQMSVYYTMHQNMDGMLSKKLSRKETGKVLVHVVGTIATRWERLVGHMVKMEE